MRILRPIVAVALVMYFAAAPLGGVALAQEEGQSIVSGADLRTALEQGVQRDAQTRERVVRVLQRAEVAEAAAGLGVDLRDAEAAVYTLGADDLAAVAGQADAIDAALSGGSGTITISIVVALLIVIIIILIT